MTHDDQQPAYDPQRNIRMEQRREDIEESERLKKELEAQAAKEAELRRQREAQEKAQPEKPKD